MSEKKVVFLAYASPEVLKDTRDFLACVPCRNKTFAVIFRGEDKFPLLQCAACGNHIGRIGWAESAPEGEEP